MRDSMQASAFMLAKSSDALRCRGFLFDFGFGRGFRARFCEGSCAGFSVGFGGAFICVAFFCGLFDFSALLFAQAFSAGFLISARFYLREAFLRALSIKNIRPAPRNAAMVSTAQSAISQLRPGTKIWWISSLAP